MRPIGVEEAGTILSKLSAVYNVYGTFLQENNTEQTTSRKTVQNGHELSPGYTEKARTGPLKNQADLATEREHQLTTARANQTTGLTNGRAAN